MRTLVAEDEFCTDCTLADGGCFLWKNTLQLLNTNSSPQKSSMSLYITFSSYSAIFSLIVPNVLHFMLNALLLKDLRKILSPLKLRQTTHLEIPLLPSISGGIFKSQVSPCPAKMLSLKFCLFQNARGDVLIVLPELVSNIARIMLQYSILWGSCRHLFLRSLSSNRLLDVFLSSSLQMSISCMLLFASFLGQLDVLLHLRLG